MEKLKIGLLYLSLHNQLIKRVGINRIINRKDFFCIIGKHFLIPKNLRYLIIKEMEYRKLINQITNDEIHILEYEFNLEKDANKFYQMVGLY